MNNTILIMAGGTGGHIMPGLAVANELKARGWQVKWLGNPERMEGRLVPQQNIELIPMAFSGLRGKGFADLIKLPFRLFKACLSAYKAIKQVQPDVVLGMGGYVSFPGAMMAKLLSVPIVVHEQNAVAGTANKVIAKFAKKILTGFPDVLSQGEMVGNPVREDLLKLTSPEDRYCQREGPLNILVVGGSLGAMALNTLVPDAVSKIPLEQRPHIVHQSGEQHLRVLQMAYQQSGVEAVCLAFIEDMGSARAQADLMICRAGAKTVAEVAATGVAALFIPLPHAIDDHQTANAAWLSHKGAAFSRVQKDLSAENLRDFLLSLSRKQLMDVALKARAMAYTQATKNIADVCENVVKG